MRKSHLYIDSRKGTVSNFSSFTYNITGQFEDITKVKVLGVNIKLSNYVINDYTNTITFNEGGGDLTATLTNGNYDENQLRAEIANKMTTAGGSYDCDYNDITGKFTLTETTPTVFTLKTSSTNFPYIQMGFINVDKSGAATYTSDYVINLSPCDVYYINIKTIPAKTVEDGRGNIPIMLNGDSFDCVLFAESGVYEMMLKTQKFNLKTIEVEVNDFYGRTAILNNHWGCLLEITHK